MEKYYVGVSFIELKGFVIGFWAVMFSNWIKKVSVGFKIQEKIKLKNSVSSNEEFKK